MTSAETMLLPCPFCGGQPDISVSGSGDTSVRCYKLINKGMPSSSAHDICIAARTKDIAISKWNTRPASAPPSVSPAEVRESANRLRDQHYAQAHTDMVGDEEERRGYLKGIAALEIALAALPYQPSAAQTGIREE